MNKKKLALLTLALVLIATIGVGATLAYFTDNDEATNTITMGHVDIELKEPNFEGGEEGGEVEDIVPGEEITKDPTIYVQDGSQDAFLRAKIELTKYEFSEEGNEWVEIEWGENEEADLLAGIDILEKWSQNPDAQGYYYYQEIAKANDEIVLFEKVVIPSKWGNEMADKRFTINVVAEAIQADSFTPVGVEKNVDEDGNVTISGTITGWVDENNNPITAETYGEE